MKSSKSKTKMSSEIKKGDKVRMSQVLMRKMIENDSEDHVKEFRNCVGICDGEYQWYNGFIGPEVSVRWQPSNLRYLYNPKDLIKVGTDD